MDPQIPASSIILLDLGHLYLVVLLKPNSKVKEKGMSGGRGGREKETFVKSVQL